MTYTDEGSGPAIVLIHGLPGSARDFRYLAPQLPGFRLIRVDLPGFGGTSRRGKRAWSVRDRARLVRDLLDALELPIVAAVAHSMGGPIAVALADLAPERVTALALLASPGLRPHRAFRRGHVHTMSRVMRLPGAPLALALPLRRAFIAMGFPSRTPTEHFVAAAQDAGMLDFSGFSASLQRLHARQRALPTLVAWAEDDPLIEPAISQELAAAAPAGPRLHWPTGGHNIQKTHAAELGAAIALLAQQAARAAS